MNRQIESACEQSIELLQRYCEEENENLVRLSHRLASLFAEGGQLLLAAGGSLQPAAQLIASQFAYRLSFDRPALPAICLGSDQILSGRMISDGKTDNILVRHYRLLNSQKHLLLVLSDGSSREALQQLCDETLENGQDIALVSREGVRDPLMGNDVGICLDLGTPLLPRVIELVQFTGHILCELVENELFGA